MLSRQLYSQSIFSAGVRPSSRRQLLARQCLNASTDLQPDPPEKSLEDYWSVRGYGRQPKWKGRLPTAKSPKPDDELRKLILTYGDLCSAAYDAVDTVSKREGKPKWRPYELLQNSFISDSSPARKFHVLKYLYTSVGVFNFEQATLRGISFDEVKMSPKRRVNLVGYIALSPKDSEGYIDLAIVLRGTMFTKDWVYNIGGNSLGDWLDFDTKQPLMVGLEKLRLHKGFTELYCETSVADSGNAKRKLWALRRVILETWLPKVLREHKVRTIITSGHSLGGALATLVAFDINEWFDKHWENGQCLAVCSKAPKRPPITIFSFASPRLGNIIFQERFNEACERNTIRHLRVVNAADPVTYLPGFQNTVILTHIRALFDVDLDDDSQLDIRVRKLLDRFNPSRKIWGYNHVGLKLEMDCGLRGRKCGGLFRTFNLLDISARHGLSMYKWLVATQYMGTTVNDHGGALVRQFFKYMPNPGPNAKPMPDFAMLNRFNNLLSPTLGIPPNWGLPEKIKKKPMFFLF